MKLISCQNGRIFTSLAREAEEVAPEKIVKTGFSDLDAIAPQGGWARGAIHELLCKPDHGTPRLISLMLARAGGNSGATVWCDAAGDLYPPAVAAAGISLNRLYLLRPERQQDALWATTECLRCRGVGVTIASVGQLSRIEARRMQLAVEQGGGMGLLFRSMILARGQWQVPPVYAAATRWLIEPMPGERTVQRWSMQLLHGHGGRIGSSVILEQCRLTHRIRAVKTPSNLPANTPAETLAETLRTA